MKTHQILRPARRAGPWSAIHFCEGVADRVIVVKSFLARYKFYFGFPILCFLIGFYVFGIRSTTKSDESMEREPSSVSSSNETSISTDKKTSTESPDEIKIPVQIATVESGSIQKRFSTFAHLQPIREATLRPQSAFVAKEVLVKWGEAVKKDQILARFESDAAKLKSELDRLDLNAREVDFNINKALAEKSFISGQEFAQKKRDYESQKVRQKLNEIESARELRSPLDGIVSEVTLRPGDYVDNNQTSYIKVIDKSSFKIPLYVPQDVAGKILPGTEVRLEKSKEIGIGKVTSIAPSVDPKTGSVLIEIVTTQIPSHWLAGIFVEASFPIESVSNTVLVPERSLLFEDSKPFVYRVVASESGETVEKVRIETGLIDGSLVQVKSGIEEFDSVVIRGQNLLKNKASIEIQEDDPQ